MLLFARLSTRRFSSVSYWCFCRPDFSRGPVLLNPAVSARRRSPAWLSARPVVSVHRDLQAWTGLVPFVRGAHGVLELPVGTIEASGTQVSDLVRLA